MTSIPHPPVDDVLASHEAVDVTAPSFEAFYRREMPGLVLLARALSGSAYADDAAQDAMLAAYRHWDQVQRFDSPVGWVRRVCANKAVSSVRRRRARIVRPSSVPSRVRSPGCGSSYERSVFHAGSSRLLRARV